MLLISLQCLLLLKAQEYYENNQRRNGGSSGFRRIRSSWSTKDEVEQFRLRRSSMERAPAGM